MKLTNLREHAGLKLTSNIVKWFHPQLYHTSVVKVLLISFHLNSLLLQSRVLGTTFVMLNVYQFFDIKFKGKHLSLFGVNLRFFASILFRNQPAQDKSSVIHS